MRIRDLAAHSACYVTVAELAEYWAVSRKQIYKRIESGALDAIKLGPRLFRVRTTDALQYEQRTTVTTKTGVHRENDRLPRKVGFQRVMRRSGTD